MIFTNPLPNYISNNTHENVVTTLKYFIFWSIFYVFVDKLIGKKNSPKMLDTKNRVISIVHGLVSFSLACYDILANKPEVSDYVTDFQKQTLLCSLGYFAYDTLACYYHGLFDLDLLLHHCMSSTGLGAGPFIGYGGTIAIYGIA
jgi:hypothetical protein